ncbi:hypothetical protein FBU30_003787 [Linnemannia zychae]|nr:hypothetical protein FBU30_003787 [Linnemannia zychae]
MRLSPLLLHSATLVASLFTFAPTAAQPSEPSYAFHPRLQCRCVPEQSCWPSTSTWSALNQTVGGRLIATTPVARECFQPYYDPLKCDEIKKGYHWDGWRQYQPGAVQQTNWETLKGVGCLANQTTSCEQGAVPLFTVNASNIADVQAAVRFAAKSNIRLVVKNTGHDYLGRSIAAHSLNLWTYFMKKINVVDSFVPEGAPPGTQGSGAVVLESGALWKDVYKAADEKNVIVVGGAEATVGAVGGYCLSGGHSPLSPRHGLCVDNVLQYKIVTADGELRVANEYQNQDLFWALRGGGPGFGVIVEAVYRTHPPVQGANYYSAVVYAGQEATMDKITRNFFSRVEKLGQDGWSGYTYNTRNYLVIMYYLFDATEEQARAGLKPFLDHALSFPNTTMIRENLVHGNSFYDVFKTTLLPPYDNNAGSNTLLGSRLIPTTMFQSERGIDLIASTMKKVQDGIQPFSPESSYLTHLVAGGQVAKGNSRDTSVLPAWRKALMHIIAAGGWLDTTPYQDQLRIQQAMTKAIDPLRAITPRMGAYQNEADPNEPDFQTNFFGSTYPRLKAIKNKYDPHGLFVCRRCVGSEDWATDEICPRRR